MTTEELSRRIRRHCLEMVARSGSSHIGSALSVTDIIAVLYGGVLVSTPSDPRHPYRDRLILSKGHACAALYAALAEVGYFDVELLRTFSDDHSAFMSHVSHRVPGVEFSTGSLGHGLPFAVGKALAARFAGACWRTFVVLSDGELDEGSNWEAMLFAAHHALDSLVAIVDYNKIQSLASVEKTLRLEPLVQKFEAFGWSVQEADGHDHRALLQALNARPSVPGKPAVLIAHTTKGKGVGFMEDSVAWHYRSPSPQQLIAALAELADA